MSRPLSSQAGHAYAPGVDIPREPHPLVQALNDLLEIALPAVLLTALMLIMLILLRLIVSALRRRRAAKRQALLEAAWMEEQEEAAIDEPQVAPVRRRFGPQARREA